MAAGNVGSGGGHQWRLVGPGLTAARALAAQGCRVVSGGRRFPRRPGENSDTLALDVCGAGSAQGFVDQVLASGRLDALVNCAGLGMTGPLEATADEGLCRCSRSTCSALLRPVHSHCPSLDPFQSIHFHFNPQSDRTQQTIQPDHQTDDRLPERASPFDARC